MNGMINATGIVDVFSTPADHDRFHDQYVARRPGERTAGRPHAAMVAPIFESLGNSSSPIVAAIFSIITFDVYMADLLPKGVDGIVAVLSNTCGDSATYELNGNSVTFLGPNDLHDLKFNDKQVNVSLRHFGDASQLAVETPGHCIYSIRLYPSDKFAGSYKTLLPVVFTVIVAACFLFMIGLFLIYDKYVDNRNDFVVDVAERSNVLVSSLFPVQAVRNRILAQSQPDREDKQSNWSRKQSVQDLPNDVSEQQEIGDHCTGIGPYSTKPIAELFLETTVMVSDFLLKSTPRSK